jgi:NADPH2:quinone reductase
VNRIMLKNVSVVGVHWSAYPERERSRVAEVFTALYVLHADRRIAPMISEEVSLDALPAALERLATRRTVGKLIVRP